MKREALLDAAEAVLFEHGTQALTLAAVAERAGVSKGGLLYHFPTKEALIKAMVTRVIDEFDDLVADYDDGSPGSYTRAYVKATFEVLTGRQGARTSRRWSAITAAASDPELIAPLREAMARWHRINPDHEPDPLASTVVRLAAEGLWEVLSHAPDAFDEQQLAALQERLLSMVAP
ncbi:MULTISPECIES: TetR/AcrR family transcriptional regulator [Thermomonospora]|uniref:Transcriptional regulator, TetR family n=1 Tax=Thermomonospora curvata (strain ATCC 19995 / DSM 43183 / JCM 3096 / KCTC 9072 / NBRC 15933 / NCIMB 10081 / Henssen B9) TaxID=471852 RepID=D1ABT2_THECD|nr:MULTISPECIES: TetR/AcrR family transcriptional regulator [Thermomonospora]ACY99105.1 transcriptional regulator, TetR family [Thermomonospora curvata DSM 43183]PKK13285.1 MAG: TetR/AcrR family transcriptional regulator [Thermomonospora sp. CIF 1]